MVLATWFGRPSIGWLLLATVFVIVGWVMHLWLERATRPPVPSALDDARPEPLDDGTREPPAVVGLLTSGYRVPPGAVPGTVLDLSARGWLELAIGNGQTYVLTENRPPADEGLSAFEQHVVGYLSSIASNGAVSAAALGRRQRMDAQWKQRFRRQVAEASQRRQLTVDRYRSSNFGSVVALGVLGLLAALNAARRSSEVALASSWRSQGLLLVVVAALVALLAATWMRYREHAQTPTEFGAQRAGRWVGYRSRLDDRIPANASVIGSPHQQRALADGVVMGVARSVYKQVPIVPETSRWGWSTAGGQAHTVRIRYPVRPGYGRHPYAVAAVGLAGFIATEWLRRTLVTLSDQPEPTSAWTPSSILGSVAAVLALLCIVPLLVACWCMVAGVFDAMVSRDHTGLVVRTRTPSEVLDHRVMWLVHPFAARSKFRTYLAVDTGEHATISAWFTSGSKTAPRGSGVRARVTPLLGYVHACEPVARADADDSSAIPRPDAATIDD